MKYIDFSVQSLMFVAVLIIVATNISDNVAPSLLSIQLVVGTWQLLSSLISVGLRARMYKLKTIHLVVSVIYISILFIIPFQELSRNVALMILMVPAWPLAVFYYAITSFVTFQSPGRQSSFLPHTSF
jgi:hypothetical protein